MAKYIVKQYVAAVGGESALNRIESMYAMGHVRMAASEFSSEEESLNSHKKRVKEKSVVAKEEMGGFVMWQKRPELWSLELVVSGYKISAGSDGKMAWRQAPWHHSHACRGPPRPLRRFLQVKFTINSRVFTINSYVSRLKHLCLLRTNLKKGLVIGFDNHILALCYMH